MPSPRPSPGGRGGRRLNPQPSTLNSQLFFSRGGRAAVPAGMVAGGEGFSAGVEGDFVRAHERVRAAAGRVAVGAALFVAEIANAFGGQLLDRVRLDALDFEEGPLDAASAHGVPAERAVGANHAVAGNEER